MDRAEIKAILDDTGVNVVYGYYDQGEEPDYPYIVIFYLDSDDFAADNENYVRRDRWQVDLVTRRRDETLEDKVETALRDQGFFIYRSATVDEMSHVMHYRFTTLGG